MLLLGLAFFQVPTYWMNYAFDIQAYLKNARHGDMEMHVLPQKAVFDLAWAHGLKPLEAEPDGSIGSFGQRISTTFLMEKIGR